MKTLCQIGFVMVLSWFIVGLPPKCNEITVQDDILMAALEKAQLGKPQSKTDGEKNVSSQNFTVKWKKVTKKRYS